jgi:hypothetical protein
LLGVAGCVFFVDTSDFGSSCQFQGQGTTCGQCVAAHCQDAVNDCCRASTCGATMGDLDTCAQGQGCARLFGDNSPVSQCVQSQCSSVCSTVGTPQGAPVYCNDDQSSPSCTCVSGSGVSGGTCSPASLGGAVLCCADTGYPTKAFSTCHCQTIRCDDNGTSCTCGTVLEKGGVPSCTKKGPGYACCKSTTTPSCFCSQTTACDKDHVDAGDTCGAAAGLACLQGATQVAACSP